MSNSVVAVDLGKRGHRLIRFRGMECMISRWTHTRRRWRHVLIKSLTFYHSWHAGARLAPYINAGLTENKPQLLLARTGTGAVSDMVFRFGMPIASERRSNAPLQRRRCTSSEIAPALTPAPRPREERTSRGFAHWCNAALLVALTWRVKASGATLVLRLRTCHSPRSRRRSHSRHLDSARLVERQGDRQLQ